MKICNFCNTENETGASACKYCGSTDLREVEDKKIAVKLITYDERELRRERREAQKVAKEIEREYDENGNEIFDFDHPEKYMYPLVTEDDEEEENPEVKQPLTEAELKQLKRNRLYNRLGWIVFVLFILFFLAMIIFVIVMTEKEEAAEKANRGSDDEYYESSYGHEDYSFDWEAWEAEEEFRRENFQNVMDMLESIQTQSETEALSE